MKRLIKTILLWSWTLTLPLSIAGGYLLYQTLDRYYTFAVRYHGGLAFPLFDTLVYERQQLFHKIKTETLGLVTSPQSSLPTINIFVPQSGLSMLNSHLPQSGFNYQDARLLIDGKLKNAKVRYRGDFFSHWAWDKKSLRVKTSKETLYKGMRRFNLLAPKRHPQLNNFLSLKLAQSLGLLTPHIEMVWLSLNGKNKGVYLLTEQPSESTLRRSKLMPGDIYSGEIIAKDRFTGIGKVWTGLFDSPSLWKKIAFNNHYADSTKAPLAKLITLLNREWTDKTEEELAQLIDMDAFGRFSAFEALANTKHFNWDHNWRLYYDPWRNKFLPLIWDPVGWDPKRPTSAFAVINTKLLKKLFQSGYFLRARDRAFHEFYNSEKDKIFLRFAESTIKIIRNEVKSDPLLRLGDVVLVSQAMDKFILKINETFIQVKNKWLNEKSTFSRYFFNENTLGLMITGYRPTLRIRLTFTQTLTQPPHKDVIIFGHDTHQKSDLSHLAEVNNNQLSLPISLIANHVVENHPNAPGKKPLYMLKTEPGFYRFRLNPSNKNNKLITVEADFGSGWELIKNDNSLTPKFFSQLKSPALFKKPHSPIIWSGTIEVHETQTINRPLTIEPGTIVRFHPNASLILTNKVTIAGTPKKPIEFLPKFPSSPPWGAVVLKGEGANGSVFSHCQMGGGSGLKGELFEYSGMLSIHDVKGLSISNCRFYDNHRVDDMVHTVYSELSFDNVTFENAVSDALDLDVSSATINNSRFINSGNDAVDLMTTQATILNTLFAQNGDKGISVGEGSHLVGINNQISNNEIGVQSKDRSTALLFNHTFMDNQIALHAYRKNWRYGGGGTIFLSKSLIRKNNKPSSAEKQSSLYLFDSAIEGELPSGKRVELEAIENDNKVKATESNYFPDGNKLNGEVQRLLLQIPQEVAQQINSKTRGANGGVD
ncbi:MAG: hypothetical protein CL388_01245 [Acidiferrobacteraceae bacterium]|nr:hypothetical protein [Acidiferrobacteraceae bacterium]